MVSSAPCQLASRVPGVKVEHALGSESSDPLHVVSMDLNACVDGPNYVLSPHLERTWPIVQVLLHQVGLGLRAQLDEPGLHFRDQFVESRLVELELFGCLGFAPGPPFYILQQSGLDDPRD